MATITEDYVSFETAKLLKKKGFPQEYDEYHSMVYNEEDYEDEYEVQRMVLETKLVKAGTLSSYPIGVPEPKCYCPTLQMAMKWLREEKNIFIDICTLSPLAYIYRVCLISDTTDYFYEDYACEEGERFMSYKEAVEFALDYCLNNILEV